MEYFKCYFAASKFMRKGQRNSIFTDLRTLNFRLLYQLWEINFYIKISYQNFLISIIAKLALTIKMRDLLISTNDKKTCKILLLLNILAYLLITHEFLYWVLIYFKFLLICRLWIIFFFFFDNFLLLLIAL